MKLTKYVHACVLVETPERVALFDPGSMSHDSFDVNKLQRLDDILITHAHNDHVDVSFVKELVGKFPEVRITTTNEVVKMLEAEGISAGTEAPTGVVFFDAPHEDVEPLFPRPQEIGIHYLDKFTDPGDSHSFNETKAILALPITAPWGSSIKALNLVLELKPKYVLPIHDWHWSDQARESMYDGYAKVLDKNGITMFKPKTGEPIEVEV